jgi:hypothetical protein
VIGTNSNARLGGRFGHRFPWGILRAIVYDKARGCTALVTARFAQTMRENS